MRKNSRGPVAVAVAQGRALGDSGDASAMWKKDLVAAALAVAASGAIVANAAFLQKGPHPAPMFASRPALAQSAPAPKSVRVVGQEFTGPPSGAAKSNAVPVEPQKAEPQKIEPQKMEPVALPRPRAESAPPRPAQPAGASRHDPIGELIAPSSKRVVAVQKALGEFGFGQIRPNGVMGPETKDAIEQFERSRKLPVTGQISPRLVRELSALTGRPLE